MPFPILNPTDVYASSLFFVLSVLMCSLCNKNKIHNLSQCDNVAMELSKQDVDRDDFEIQT